MRKISRIITSLLFTFAALTVWAAPPYDITVTFDAPLTGGPPDGYNLYIDDCAATGATAAPFAIVTNGQTFAGALTADGSYLVCVRPFNAAGETLDPVHVATVDVTDLPLPGPINNLAIQITCPLGSCTVNVSVN